MDHKIPTCEKQTICLQIYLDFLLLTLIWFIADDLEAWRACTSLWKHRTDMLLRVSSLEMIVCKMFR